MTFWHIMVLSMIYSATKCNLLQCIDENHSVEINKFYNNIMQACMKLVKYVFHKKVSV